MFYRIKIKPQRYSSTKAKRCQARKGAERMLFALIILLAALFITSCPAKGEEGFTPPQGIVPIAYHFWGTPFSSSSYPPNAGAVGAWTTFRWDAIQPGKPSFSVFDHPDFNPDDPRLGFNFAPIENYLNGFSGKKTTLKNGKEIDVPLSFQVAILFSGGMCEINQSAKECSELALPDWLIDELGVNKDGVVARSINPPDADDSAEGSCGKYFYPNSGNKQFQKRWAEMVMVLGKKYDNDPRVNFIHIATGPDGEAITTMFNQRTYEKAEGGTATCPRAEVPLHRDWIIGDPASPDVWKRGVIHIYREAFKNKPIFIINTGSNYRVGLAERALEVSPHAGIKMHSWHPDLPGEYEEGSHVRVLKWYRENCQNDCLIGLEHAYAQNRHFTYWAMMYALAHKATLFDFSQSHIQALAEVEICEGYPDCFPLWAFVEDHLAREASNAPDVFVVLRDTSFKEKFYTDPRYDRRGEFGNWSFYMDLICQKMGNEEGACSEYPAVDNAVTPANSIYRGTQYFARKITNNPDRMNFVIDSAWPALKTVGVNVEVSI